MNKKVTAIGEILFDVYPDYKKIGGAPFNFIYHVWKLTGPGNFISKIGNDSNGKEILEYLQSNKFNTEFIQKDEDHLTGTVDVVLDSNKVPSFEIVKNRAYDFIEVTNSLISHVENADLFYFGSLAQRNEISRNTIQQLSQQAKKSFCDLNIRQNYYNEGIINASLELSSVVKLNSDELQLVNSLLMNEKYELKETAISILNKYELELLCITVGSEGAYLFDGKTVSHSKAEIDKIVDTVGAGDAFAAMMSIGYLNRWNIEKINKLASEFAAEICTVQGAIPEDGEIYNKFMERINDE